MAQLRRPQPRTRSPGALHAGLRSSSTPPIRVWSCAHTSPVQIRTMLTQETAHLHGGAGSGVPHRQLDATHTPVFKARSRPWPSTGDYDGPPQGTPRPLRGRVVRRRDRHPPATVVLPFTEPSAELDLQCFVCRGVGKRPGSPYVARAAVKAGSSGAAAEWSILGCCAPVHRPGRVPRLRLRHGVGADADVPARHHRHARHGWKAISVSPFPSDWRSDARPRLVVARVRPDSADQTGRDIAARLTPPVWRSRPSTRSAPV